MAVEVVVEEEEYDIEPDELFENVTVVENVDIEDIKKAFEESLEDMRKAEKDVKEGIDIVEDINDDIKKANGMHEKVNHPHTIHSLLPPLILFCIIYHNLMFISDNYTVFSTQ